MNLSELTVTYLGSIHDIKLQRDLVYPCRSALGSEDLRVPGGDARLRMIIHTDHIDVPSDEAAEALSAEGQHLNLLNQSQSHLSVLGNGPHLTL